MSFNVAIDGPAGAGKSTVAKSVAALKNFIYVDTGAMYRAMALYFLRQGIDKTDENAINAVLDKVEITIRYEDGAQQVILNGENVSGLIRTEEVGNMASATSVYKKVREKLVELQKDLAKKADVIMDGRDIGTCVLPDADVKIFLSASPEVRARRRWLELQEKGTPDTYEAVLADLIVNDLDLGIADHIEAAGADGLRICIGKRSVHSVAVEHALAVELFDHFAGRLAGTEAGHADLIAHLEIRLLNGGFKLLGSHFDGDGDLALFELFNRLDIHVSFSSVLSK